jgi:tetratricopeptide (TPR) repeat protein
MPASTTISAGPTPPRGTTPRALEYYNQAVERDQRNPDLFNDRGSTFSVLGDLDKALADFDKAISLKSDYALGHANRAWVLAAKNKHEEAVAEYDMAIKLDPSVPERFNDRGYFLLRTGQYDRAIAKPGFSMALENRGWAYWLKGDLDKALADFDEAVRLNPDDLNVLTDRSAILDDKGDYDRAIADLDKVLAKQPDNGRALNGRAWAHAQNGDLDKALADSERAVAILPGKANVLHTRAWIYMNKGVLDLALADFDKAIGIDPELAGAYADRGRAFELKGDRDKAIADYRKSLALKSRQTYDDKAKAEALQHLTTLAAVTPGSPPSVAESGGHDQGKQAEPAAPEKRIALVIGNANYVNVKALKNSDSDARELAAAWLRGDREARSYPAAARPGAEGLRRQGVRVRLGHGLLRRPRHRGRRRELSHPGRRRAHQLHPRR